MNGQTIADLGSGGAIDAALDAETVEFRMSSAEAGEFTATITRGIVTIDHNIWEDPEAAAVVRSHARGNETVPTVVIDGVGLVNPSAREVTAFLERSGT